jgi:hypothetical protein
MALPFFACRSIISLEEASWLSQPAADLVQLEPGLREEAGLVVFSGTYAAGG